MRRSFQILSLLALSLITSAGIPTESMRKEYLMLTVRADSGCAQRFTVESTGFRIFGPRGQARANPNQAGDTISVIGAGTVKLVSAEPGKPLSVDVWMWSGHTSEPVRYRGATVKVDRTSFVAPYQVTTP